MTDDADANETPVRADPVVDPVEIPCPRGHGPVRVDGQCMVCGHDIAIGGER